MFLRPLDASGDILPVLSSSDLLSGPEAAAKLVQYRLSAKGIDVVMKSVYCFASDMSRSSLRC